MIRYLALGIVAFILQGCVSTVDLGSVGEAKIRKIDEKNYTLGFQHSVYVGEKMIARKSYDAILETGYVEVSNAFTLVGGLGSAAVAESGARGDQYKIIGTNDEGNFAVSIPNSHLSFGVTSGGVWDDTIGSPSFWTAPVWSEVAYTLDPPTTKFLQVESEIPLTEDGYINHELIYTGVGSDGIHLLYREYTFENRARSAFSQELVYPVDSETIRFKDYQILVVSATSSEITFAVIAE